MGFTIFTSMILLNKLANGSFTIALADKYAYSGGVNYSFTFEHEVTSEQITITYTDISLYPTRYSEFNYLSSTFTNSTTGFWRYYVSIGGNQIATGRMILKVPAQVPTEYNGYDGSAKTYQM